MPFYCRRMNRRPYSEHEPFVQAAEFPNLAYKQGRKQCFSVPFEDEDGKTYYVYMKEPPTARNLTRSRKAIQRDLRLYTGKTFAAAPDGIYAWLLTDIGFFAAPVRNILELGSRHIQIADRVGASKVFLGGECEKTGATVVYNLLSGSFMRDLETLHPDHDFKSDAVRMFADMGLTPMFTDVTLITTPVTVADLRYYKSLGYKLWLYETENACLSGSWTFDSDADAKGVYEKQLQKLLRKREEYEANGAKAIEDYKKAIDVLAELEAKPLDIPANANNATRTRLKLEAERALATAIYKRDSAAQSVYVWNESIKNVLKTIQTIESAMNPKEFVGGGRRRRRVTRRSSGRRRVGL